VFIKIYLKEFQIKNREDDKSNHRVVAMYYIQWYLYNVDKIIGGKEVEKSLIYYFGKKKYVYSIEESALYLFWRTSYLLQPIQRGGE
jgi:hypothetical protein